MLAVPSRHILLKDESDHVVFSVVYSQIKPKLHTILSHDDSINQLILQAASKFKFDNIEYTGVLHSSTLSPKNKLLKLTQLVDSRILLDPNIARDFINFLLNLDGLDFVIQIVTKTVAEVFPGRVSIIGPKISIDPEETQENAAEYPLISTPTPDKAYTNPTCNTYKKVTISGLLLGFLVTMSIFTILGLVILGILVTGYASAVIPKTDNVLSTFNSTTTTTIPTTAAILLSILPESDSSNVVTEKSLMPDIKITTSRSKKTNVGQISQHVNLSTIQNIQLGSLPEYKVKAKSYQEYINSMKNIPLRHDVAVFISVQNPFDWPNIGYTLLPNSTEINKLYLGGLLAVDNVIDILGQCPNLEHLHLVNSGDKLCQRNHGQLNLVKQINKQAYLPLLHYLVLRDLSRCTEIYETLAMYMKPLPSLRRLTIYRSLLDDHNHVFLQEFLKNQGKNIKELKITETTMLITEPFLEASSEVFFMRNVERMRLDSRTSVAHENEIRIGKNFPKIFPNLREFFSIYGYIKWDKFSNLVRCKKLTELTVGIKVSSNRTYFDVSFLSQHLPLLTKAVISLKFKTCSSPGINNSGKNSLSGWENLREPINLIVIRSNCKIYANTVNALRNDTEEKYNGSYMFTYKILKD